MAKTLTPLDAYALINALVKQGTGQQTITATDVSSFISVGEKLLASGHENVLNSLSLVLGRTLVASRSYKARFSMLNALNTGVYANRMRKISFYNDEAMPTGAWNTDLYTNLETGFTAGENPAGTPPVPQSTKSQYEQRHKEVLEVNFGGSNVWEYGITRTRDQLKVAFRSPEDFNDFVAGILTEVANDIESEMEAFNRMTLVSEIAKRYFLEANNITTGCAINLTAGFNAKFNTSYTSAQLRSTYLKDFLAYMVSVIKTISDRMEERGCDYHDIFTNANGKVILRHTPKDRQRMFLYGPLLRDAESLVMPEIFNPQYLNIDKQFERVEYWQSNLNDTVRPQISMESAYLDHGTGVQTTTGNIALDYVVGCIYDVDAVMTNFILDSVDTSPLESRKKYYNIWYDFARQAITDQTENFVVFYMKD